MLEQPGGGVRPQLRERGLGEILGEAFSIYGARARQMIAISAVVQIPVSALAFIPTQSLALSAAFALVGGAASTLVYAAIIAAVAQNLALGRISVGGCYARVAGRGITVLTLAALYAAILAAMVFPLEPFAQWAEEVSALAESAADAESGDAAAPDATTALAPATDAEPPSATAPALPPAPPAGALIALLALMAVSICAGVYMTTTAPSIIVEGRKGFGALARGFRLARGSEWRILGHSIVYLLVFIGLTVAVFLPFMILGLMMGEDTGGALSTVGATASTVIALPVLYIAATLLYFDIRLRKEGYDAARLSAEMGAPPPPA